MARTLSKRDWFSWISRISFRADSLVYSVGAGKRSGAEADAEQSSHKAEAYPRCAPIGLGLIKRNFFKGEAD
jgi:hypothetical protein